jgi:hypothetical protein
MVPIKKRYEIRRQYHKVNKMETAIEYIIVDQDDSDNIIYVWKSDAYSILELYCEMLNQENLQYWLEVVQYTR